MKQLKNDPILNAAANVVAWALAIVLSIAAARGISEILTDIFYR